MSVSVLMVITSFPPAYSGAAHALIKLSRGLIANGMRVSTVCALPVGAKARERLEQIDVFRLHCGRYTNLSDVPSFTNQLLFGLRSALFILRHRKEFDVIHFHGVGRVTVFALLAARWARLPTLGKITHINHDSPSAHTQRLLGRALVRMLGAIDAFIAVSPRIASDIEEAACWRETAVYQIPNPIDSSTYSPLLTDDREASRRTLEFEPDEVVFLFVGAISKGKGIDTLVAAWRTVRERSARPVKLLAMGPPFDPTMVEMLENAEGVTYSGTISVEQVREYYRVADIFVLPTRGEGLPNVVIEAMSCALPCIAGRLDGITDYLLDSERGLLVDPEDAQGLAAAMLRLLEDRQNAQEMGCRAREWVLDNADLTAVAARYQEIYLGLIGDHR